MSEIKVNKISPSSGTTFTVGDSGDTFNIPSGVTLANSGTVTGLPASAINSGSLADARIPNLNTSKLTAGTLADARIPNLNASKITAGTIATARLGSGTASSGTFLRGDQTYAAAGGGKILQVISDTKTDSFSTTVQTPTDVTGLAVAITPSATSSKILVMLTLGSFQTSDEGARAMLILARNLSNTNTSLIVGDANTGFETTLAVCTRSNSGTHQQFPASFTFLDSPNTTSQCIYKPQVGRGPDNSGNVVINRSNAQDSNSGNTASTITVMEISA